MSETSSSGDGAKGGIRLTVEDNPFLFDIRGHNTLDDGSTPDGGSPPDGGDGGSGTDFDGDGEPDEESHEDTTPEEPACDILIPQYLVDLGDVPPPQAGKFLKATGPNTFIWDDAAGGGGGDFVYGDNGHEGANKPGTRRGVAGAWIEARNVNGTVEIHHVGPVSDAETTIDFAINGDPVLFVHSITFDRHGHYNGTTGNLTVDLPIALGDLSDVVLTGPVNGHGLYFDGNNWVNFNRDTDDSRDLTVIGGDEVVDFSIQTSTIQLQTRPITITITRNKLNGAITATRSQGAIETHTLARTNC